MASCKHSDICCEMCETAIEHYLWKEEETILREAGFVRGSTESTILLFMQDELGIEITEKEFAFVSNIVKRG